MVRRSFILVCISLLAAMGALAQGDTTAKPTAAATVTETAKSTVRFTPNKDQIMQGQKVLKEAKLYTGDATGVYNNDTRAAIRTWQKDNGIPVTGNFNRATLEKMGIAITDKQKGASATVSASADGVTSGPSAGRSKSTASSKPAPASDGATAPTTASGPKRPAPFQATNEQIKQLQQKLIDAKLFTGAADGQRSDALKAAITKYQSSNGLKSTGGINAATLEKAGIALTDKQKEQVAAQAAYDAGKPSSKQD